MTVGSSNPELEVQKKKRVEGKFIEPLQCSGLHIHLPSEKSVVRFWEETEILWKFKPNIQSYLLWQPHVIKLKAAESSFFYSTVIMSFLAR